MITLSLELIAETCHEANRVLQKHFGEQVSPSWEETTEEMRESARDGVLGVLGGATPKMSHENWMHFRLKNGWVYGEVKDVEAKTHPCLVPYHELDEKQKFKDKMFVGIVETYKDPV